jgi:hypothetical protein
VAVQDSQGNTVTSSTVNVTVAIVTNPGGGTLSGTATIAAVSGVATFSTLSINKSGTGYTLGATAPASLASAPSTGFTITAAAAAQLAFTVQPGNTVAGASIDPGPRVAVQDAFGNTVTTSTAMVAIAIVNNPSTGTVSGTTTVAAVAGLANFAGLSINKVGTGYTLGATSGSLMPTPPSSAFNITVGAAAQLSFTVQPTTATAGASISPAVKVTVEDSQGNPVTTSTASIAVAITLPNTPGGTLGGTATVSASAGVATFNNLSINKSGSYTLTATSSGLTSGTSASFTINPGTATKVVFLVQPSNAVSAATLTPSPQVEIQDVNSNRVTGSTAMVTLAIVPNAGGAVLSGTVTVAATAGVATFPGLSIDKAANGYTLNATSGSLTLATSTAFNITPGPAAKLAFTVNPSNAVAGAAISPAVQVTVQDAQGNTVSSTASIVMAFDNNAGGGSLTGTLTVAAVAGVATFSNLLINRPGTGYTLRATSGTLTLATSAAFNISVGAASQVAFTVQPSNTVAGAFISPAVQVTIQDSQGNTTASTANVVLAIAPPNANGGSLAGTTTVAAVAGVATFSNLSIAKAGSGYALTATSGALPVVTSSTFTIAAGAAAKLAFLVQPVTTAATIAITPSPQVEIQDSQGNRVVSSTLTIGIAIGTNPNSGVLSGTTSVAAVSGVATFPGLSIDKTGTGYTLVATSAPLTQATSTAFDIDPAPPAKLAITVQPVNTVSGAAITPAVQVTIQDSQGNTVTNSTLTINMAIGTNPGSGTLGGTVAVAAVAGVATFSTLTIDKAGTGYTLVATSGALTLATSTAFNITAGTASQIAFAAGPVTAVAGVCTAITIDAQDANGNVTTVSGNKTFGITAVTGATYYEFAADCAASTPTVTTVRINSGASSATFYFKSTVAGSLPLVLTPPAGFTGASQTETIIAGTPVKTIVAPTTITTLASGCSAATTVTIRDTFNNDANGAFTVNLTTNAPNQTFYSDAACTTALVGGALAIPMGSSTGTFYSKTITGTYVGTTNTPFTVNATGTGITTVGTQANTINNTVRAGTCTSSGFSVNCTVTPAVTDTTKAFFVFEATNSTGSAQSGNVRCVLASASTITCTRQGNNNPMDIQYYLVEYPSGITVQHLTPTCSGTSQTQTHNISAVSNVNNAFVLFSSEKLGTNQSDATTYRTAALTSTSTVAITYGAATPCANGEQTSLQVVDFTGSTVKTGSVSSMTATTLSTGSGNIGGGPADLSLSFLLYSWRLASPSTSAQCNQMLRGELDSTSSALFLRGDGAGAGTCATNAIDSINWQRIQLPAGNVVSAQTVELSALQTSNTSGAFTAVDPTRTAVFTGGQWASGQSNGETDYSGNDLSHTSRARLTLSGSNTTLTFTRASTGTSKAKFTGYVVQFLP